MVAAASLTEDQPVEVLPVDKDKDARCFLLVAAETRRLETGMTRSWKIMTIWVPL